MQITQSIAEGYRPVTHIADVPIQPLSIALTSLSEAHSRKKVTTNLKVCFLSLPAELRNHIYELVVVKDEYEPIEIRDKAEPHDESGEDERLQPSLSHACRQLRDEVLPIYYGRNRFVAPLEALILNAISRTNEDLPDQRVQSTFRRWLTAIGHANIKHITDVRLVAPMIEDWPYNRTFELIYKYRAGLTMAVDSGPASAENIEMAIDALFRPLNERPKGKALSILDVQKCEEALHAWVRKHYLWKFDDNDAGYQLTFWDIPF